MSNQTDFSNPLSKEHFSLWLGTWWSCCSALAAMNAAWSPWQEVGGEVLPALCFIGEGRIMCGVNSGVRVDVMGTGASSYWHPASRVSGVTCAPRHTWLESRLDLLVSILRDRLRIEPDSGPIDEMNSETCRWAMSPCSMWKYNGGSCLTTY